MMMPRRVRCRRREIATRIDGDEAGGAVDGAHDFGDDETEAEGQHDLEDGPDVERAQQADFGDGPQPCAHDRRAYQGGNEAGRRGRAFGEGVVDGEAAVSTDHEEGALGKVEDVEQAEDDGKPRGDEEEEHALVESGEQHH
jgi:hypothetical protein